MIIKCDNCASEFEINQNLIKRTGSKFRCSECKHVFKVFPPTPSPVEMKSEKTISAEAEKKEAENTEFMADSATEFEEQLPEGVHSPEDDDMPDKPGGNVEETVFVEDDTMTQVDFSEEVFGPTLDTTVEHYVELGNIGEGGMGEVRLAKDTRLLRKVAIKSIKNEAATPTAVSYFLREAQITAQLDHPNIVPLYTVKEPAPGERNVSFVMKLIKGKTLSEIIIKAREFYQENPKGEPEGDASLTSRLDYFLKACEGVIYAHRKQVVHRDLKPSNIMIGEYGEVYIMDWGIAKMVKDDPGTLMSIEKLAQQNLGLEEGGIPAGSIVGTPGYMSPEQARGLPDVGPASDQFSLGVILYELVTCQSAREGDVRKKLRWAEGGYINEIIHYISGKAIPPELEAIIHKATAADPFDRYPSVAALTEDVRRFVRGDEVSELPDNSFRKAWRWMNKHRYKTFIFFLMTIVIALSAAIWSLAQKNSAMRAAQIREKRLTVVLSQISAHAHNIDNHFLRLEDLLLGVASDAMYLIQDAPPNNEKYYWLDNFNNPDDAPEDLAYSTLYDKLVSIDYPVVKLAPGVQPQDVESIMQRLAPLRHHYKRTLLNSRGSFKPVSDEEARRLLTVHGLPISWIYIGLEAGVMYSYPGKGTYPPEYDPRVRPWYGLGRHKYEAYWGNPYFDLQGLGRVLPCATSLYDRENRFFGVVGMDVTFTKIIRDNLTRPGAVGVVESFLLDDKGRIVVSSSQLNQEIKEKITDSSLKLETFPIKEVVQAINRKESGMVEVKRDDISRLIVYQKMSSLNWYYVEEADTATILNMSMK